MQSTYQFIDWPDTSIILISNLIISLTKVMNNFDDIYTQHWKGNSLYI